MAVPSQPSPFANDRHALYVGWVVGIARKHHVPVTPILDDEGNYTNELLLTFDNQTVRITLVVPEPPDDWVVT